MNKSIPTPRLAADAYDRTSADEFMGIARPKKPLRSATKKQRKELRKILEPQPFWSRYSKYIESEAWKRRKERLLKQRGNTCERCGVSGSVTRLDLHHLTYARVFHENDDDLKLYCRKCHQLMHPNKRLAK